MQSRFLSAIGLAKRAGKVVTGTDAVRDTMKKRCAEITVIASDASDNTKKEIFDTASFYSCEACLVPFTMSELSHALGKISLTACAAITDISFKTLIKNSLEHQEV